MAENSGKSSGIGAAGLLGVAFVVLKLCGVIHWSWWWVTAPFWGGFAILISVMLVVGLLGSALGMKPRIRYNPPQKSKWQTRIEEMQKEQRQQQEARKR